MKVPEGLAYKVYCPRHRNLIKFYCSKEESKKVVICPACDMKLVVEKSKEDWSDVVYE